MKWQLYLNIVARIIILFTLAMMFTFVPEHLRTFFGDTYTNNHDGGIDQQWTWGNRHYWYFCMCMFLFIVTCINCVVGICHACIKHYPKTFS